MTIKLAVSGATGRMGHTILTLADGDPQFALAAALENPSHPAVGKPLHETLHNLKKSAVQVESDPAKALKGVQVLVDFTQPEASLGYIKAALESGTALVIGTTGFSEAEMGKVRDAAKKIPIVQSYNMSVGMNLLFALVEQAAKRLGQDYDVEITEAHHNLKKDAPSGSAIRLGEGVARAWGAKLSDISVHGRVGKVGERKKGSLGIHAVRGGDIVGDHTVLYAGPGERLELTHRAHSRETFAAGALKAAQWLSTQKPGLYDMWDVLGLK